MPPAPRRPSDEPSSSSERKLIQTKLNFPRASPRPSPSAAAAAAAAPSSSSASASSSGTSSPHFATGVAAPQGQIRGGDRGPDGLYRDLQWVRQDAPQKQSTRNYRGGDNNGAGDDGYSPGARNAPRTKDGNLAAIAAETLTLIPGVLALHPAPPPSRLFTAAAPPPPLDPAACPSFVLPYCDPEGPGYPGTRIRVVDGDTFNVALSLGQVMSDPLPVLVLNLANARTAGGGWLTGSMAQEEELCYRSTLSATLTPAFYPLPPVSAIYSPEVIVFRTSVRSNHSIIPRHEHKRVSVLSMAAQYAPALTPTNPPKYAVPADRILMRDKIRLLLRVAAHMGHTRLVLGALGCGVFMNPSAEVAEIFLEVFLEAEFTGGWWRDVVFAVLDTEHLSGRWGKWGDGPYGAFWKNLNDFPV
ncbi:uncharacterized protein H6S33_007440 [Morchella sextelata]|uniref:uncharacterized protein n=1 Tax=Morchella sextelata TaxID=1174677 RepID=UPI001D049D6E|nr:uncharacterized protein H6S33_007440 [Morchella sextelata]KAH0603781.1 hypothetical protein H6S33_007440 [Morchella sextelata]